MPCYTQLKKIQARPLLLIIAGPTATGKTGIALELAEHAPVEVISADSRQVYRGLDVGTAKPTLGRAPARASPPG